MCVLAILMWILIKLSAPTWCYWLWAFALIGKLCED